MKTSIVSEFINNPDIDKYIHPRIYRIYRK